MQIDVTSHTEKFIREIMASPDLDFSESPGEHIIEFACLWLHAALYSERVTGSRELLEKLQAMVEALAAQRQHPPDGAAASTSDA